MQCRKARFSSLFHDARHGVFRSENTNLETFVLDQFLQSVNNINVAITVIVTNVAWPQPSIVVQTTSCGFRIFIVTFHYLYEKHFNTLKQLPSRQRLENSNRWSSTIWNDQQRRSNGKHSRILTLCDCGVGVPRNSKTAVALRRVCS